MAPAPSLTLQSPTRGTHRALTLLTPVAAVATAAVGWLAWSEGTTSTAVLAAGLVVLTLLLWSALRRRPDTVVTVESGTLRIEQGQHRHVFPLDRPYPPIDILGDPDGRAWKVLIHRRSMSPYVVTRAMVDPHEFTELVRHYRPDA